VILERLGWFALSRRPDRLRGLNWWSLAVRSAGGGRWCVIEARNRLIPRERRAFLRSSVTSDRRGRFACCAEPSSGSPGSPARCPGDAGWWEASFAATGAATRVDPRAAGRRITWLAPLAHLEPARAPGLAAVTAMLLDAGADIDGESAGRLGVEALECASSRVSNSQSQQRADHRLLLGAGCSVRSETLLASLYAADGTWCERSSKVTARDSSKRQHVGLGCQSAVVVVSLWKFNC